MLTDPLPRMLDIRQAAARGVPVSGTVRLRELPRFRPLLSSDAGSITAFIDFARDDENRWLVKVRAVASVHVDCQRCLEAMPVQFTGESVLALVWTDREAACTPRHLEPLVVTEEPVNLWDVVEEELMLGMPAYSYHAPADCAVTLAQFSGQVMPDSENVDDKPNPFNVLGQLKPGKKS